MGEMMSLDRLSHRARTAVDHEPETIIRIGLQLDEMVPTAERSELQSADIVLPTTDGREIRLRRITEPTAEQKLLLRQLGVNLPEHLQSSCECSADSAIA